MFEICPPRLRPSLRSGLRRAGRGNLKFGWHRLAARQVWAWGLGAVLLIVVAWYGGRAILAGPHGPVSLVIYAFSTQEEVLTQSIFPAFEETWEAETGRDLTIQGVFGPSGTLAGQINLGAPADVALLSNEQHINWLKIGRRVPQDAEALVVSSTPMVIVTRPGNPAGIADYGDLARPGLRLLHADPRTSGAGDWAVLAEYGSALLESGDQAAARAQLEAIWRNVRWLAPSARATLTLFELGAGDALVTYEQDARLAETRGVLLEIVIPPRTIIAHHVVVKVDANLTAAERPAARAFVAYLMSDAGQQAFMRYQLRPSLPTDDRRPATAVSGQPSSVPGEEFPPILHPFTVEDLGGWSQAYAELVDGLWQTEIEPYIEVANDK